MYRFIWTSKKNISYFDTGFEYCCGTFETIFQYAIFSFTGVYKMNTEKFLDRARSLPDWFHIVLYFVGEECSISGIQHLNIQSFVRVHYLGFQAVSL